MYSSDDNDDVDDNRDPISSNDIELRANGIDSDDDSQMGIKSGDKKSYQN